MQRNTLVLSADQKAMWAEAGITFPGNQLDKVIERALSDLSTDQLENFFYEIRRFDAPHAFNSLLKLQNTGAARRHIEVVKNEFHEVLRIDAGLFDLIMRAMAMLLDVFLRLLGGTLKSRPAGSREPPEVKPTPNKYVPSWQRQFRIESDRNDGYTR
ncbi:hypothetical protein GIW41_19330 [Pseudomonas sp. PA-6-1D]|uniref:hypothetical protein n=1 Tax=Pseudomonas TaxID=286 RepID=UPI001EEFB6A7|nr:MULTISPECIES: hypothetical protein [Pseudomonas]MCF5140162.1 hypothetical protein [Pseudomonas sp. PA-6-3C]MCF5145345.1 hypothetical protein [Pseudomonas sp. PA-6-3F]MCF5157659.1 hypothetical protein [Pseudomonas sp. PA-6-2E]MCF5177415.1 hypothetical protein [Pseudomonas sp. PA-6-1D]MCF5194154.1 hypothetical protein [Pseudomonas sp. PA-6-1H]